MLRNNLSIDDLQIHKSSRLANGTSKHDDRRIQGFEGRLAHLTQTPTSLGVFIGGQGLFLHP